MNRFGEHVIKENWRIQRVTTSEFASCMALQEEVIAGIEENEEKNIFQPLTREEMSRAIEQGDAIGLYEENHLIAQMNLLVNPTEEENITLDLEKDGKYEGAVVLDWILVRPEKRGQGIQRMLLSVAEEICKEQGKSGICAVTSPLNTHSLHNFLAQGYELVATKPKYRSVRHYLWKDLRG